MESEVMLLCQGGELLGPYPPRTLKRVVESGQKEIQFVISAKKGWVPVDTYLHWIGVRASRRELFIEKPGETTKVSKMPKRRVWLLWLIALLVVLLGLAVGWLWVKWRILSVF